MERTQFWKNFRLGEEIGVSGAFIYNEMRRFHEMRMLDFSDEVFEVLYNLSVGFERLLKIAVVLIEHKDEVNQDELERSLITHTHLDLMARIKKKVQINIGPQHNDFLQLLGTFYKSIRYDRFTLSSAYHSEREVAALCEFLRKHLNVDIPSKSPIFGTSNEGRYREFLRKTVLTLSRTLYEVIKSQAELLNLYTYELRHASKAESVFLREVDISHEDVLWKELLIFFMNTKSSSGYLAFLRSIKPLEFDPELVGDYLDCFQSDASKASVMDELESHYEELAEATRERLEQLAVIAAPNVYFDFPEDEEDFDP